MHVGAVVASHLFWPERGLHPAGQMPPPPVPGPGVPGPGPGPGPGVPGPGPGVPGPGVPGGQDPFFSPGGRTSPPFPVQGGTDPSSQR